MSLFSLTVTSGLTSCVTTPVSTAGSDSILQWYGQGKAKIEGQNNNFSIRSYTKEDNHGRVEVLGPVGIVVAQIVWNPKSTMVLLPNEKKFYSFSSSSVGLKSVFGFDLTVGNLGDVLLDRDFSDPKWSCDRMAKSEWSKDNQLQSVVAALSPSKAERASFERCMSANGLEFIRLRGVDGRFFVGKGDGTSVLSKSSRSTDSKLKKATDGQSTLQFQLLQVRSKVEENASSWSLDAPEGFRVIRK